MLSLALAILLLASPSIQKESWISQCGNIVEYDWSHLNCSIEPSSQCPILVDSSGHQATDLTPGNAWGITIDDCYHRCGNIHSTFSFTNFSSAATNWLLPWLALSAQLPYETAGPFQNVLSGLLAVGSPAFVAYSLALTMLMKVRINEKFEALWKTAEQGSVSDVYPVLLRRIRSARALLTESLQTPMRAWEGEGWLSRLILQNGFTEFWKRLEGNLSDTRRGVTVSLVFQLLFAVVAWIFTIAAAFSNVGDVTTGLSLSSSSLWLWMIPVVAGWVAVGTQYRQQTVQNALQTSFYGNLTRWQRQNGINNCAEIPTSPHFPLLNVVFNASARPNERRATISGMGAPSDRLGLDEGNNQSVNSIPLVVLSSHNYSDGAPAGNSEPANNAQMLPGRQTSRHQEGTSGHPRSRETDPQVMYSSIAESTSSHPNVSRGSTVAEDWAEGQSVSGEEQNTIRRLSTRPTTHSIPFNPIPQICGISPDGDEATEGPIFNYARIFTAMRFVEIVETGFKNSLEKLSVRETPTGTWSHRKSIWKNLQGTDHEISKFCGYPASGVDHLQAYPKWTDIPPRTFRDIFVASLFAIFLQWGTTGPPIWMSITTPTTGLSCRSGGYLIYGCIATLAWILIVTSSFLSHALMLRIQKSQNDDERDLDPAGSKHNNTNVLVWLFVLSRYLGRLLACLNAPFLLIITIFELCGLFDSCYCTGVKFARGHAGWATLFETSVQLGPTAEPVWVGGVVLAATISLLAWTFIGLGARYRF